MRTTCKELKRISRENLTFHYMVPLGAFVLLQLISTLLESPFTALMDQYASALQQVLFYIAEFLILLVTLVLTFGLYYIHLNMARKKEIRISQLFYAFRNRTDKFLLGSLFLLLITALAVSPSIAAGFYLFGHRSASGILVFSGAAAVSLVLLIVVQIQFQLFYFVLVDHEEMGVLEAIRRNNLLIKRNRGRLFYINLSFVGMLFLGILSLGIGLLWVMPYMFQTMANFYLDVSGELGKRNVDNDGNPQQDSFNQYV